MPPKVSVLVPTYNRARFLRDAIQSALAQTHQNIEVLVLDDASPDDTAEMVAEFAGDARLAYIRHPENRGIVANWRAGIEAAHGDFFCLLHDDDTIEPSFVEALLAPLVQDETLILSFCDHWEMDAAGGRLAKETEESSRRFRRRDLPPGRLAGFAQAAVIDGSPPIGATLFRRRLVLPQFIQDQAKGSIDAWLFYQCVKSGHGAYYVPERLMNHRVHPGGMSASMPLYMTEGHLFRYQTILADAEMAALHPQIRGLKAEALTSYGISLMAQGEVARARRSLREAARIQPRLRTLVALALAYSGRLGVETTMRLKAPH